MKRRTMLLLAALALGAGCSEEATQPEIAGGAGLRLLFDVDADSLAWVRVEIWDENPVPWEPCGSKPVAERLLAGDPDECTRMQVAIRDLEGKPVRFVADTPSEKGGLSYGWDTKDDGGNEVPSGYYPVTSTCLDSRNRFEFFGHYLVARDREKARDEWPLWIRETAPSGNEISFGPFPTLFQTKKLDCRTGLPTVLVNFRSPFLLRVHAPGMRPFEQEIVLEEEKFTQVDVELLPEEAKDKEESP